jgi:hypothetical protein
MTLSASRVSSRCRFFLGAIVAATLALAPQIALAQHGGGGGHFGGGGGAHFGGAPSGSHSAPAPASHSSSRPSASVRPPSAPVASTNVRNSVNAGSRPALSSPVAELPAPAGFARGNAAVSSDLNAAPTHTTIGFPPSTSPGAEGWEPLTAFRGGVLSFSGQGHDIWQNLPGVTSPGGAAAHGTVAGSRPEVNELTAQPRMLPPTRSYPRPIPFGRGFGFFGPGFGFNPFLFGFGPYCDPYWNSGCDSFGYVGGYGAYGYYPYVYDPGAYASANGDADDSGQYSGSDNLAASNDTSTTVTVLYLKSGGSFAVTDYWLANGQVEYLTSFGGENSVGLDELDIARTVTENSAHGVSFVLRSGPDSTPATPAAAPDSSPAPQQ